MKKFLLLILFVSFGFTYADYEDKRTPNTDPLSNLEGCSEFFSADPGTAGIAVITECRINEVISARSTRTVDTSDVNEYDSESMSVNALVGLETALTEKNLMDKYLVFPILMFLFLASFAIGITVKLINNKIDLSKQEKDKLLLAAIVTSGSFWFIIGVTLSISILLLTIFISRYNEVHLLVGDEDIYITEIYNDQLKESSQSFAKSFAISALETRIVENQMVMIGVNHKEDLMEQIDTKKSYQCLMRSADDIGYSFKATKMYSKYAILEDCSKSRGYYPEPTKHQGKIYTGTEEAFNRMSVAAEVYIDEYLKYHCSVSNDGYDNGGSDNEIICSNFRTGTFYPKIKPLDGVLLESIIKENKVALEIATKAYIDEVGYAYIDYSNKVLTTLDLDGEPPLDVFVQKENETDEDREDRYNTYVGLQLDEAQETEEMRKKPYQSFLKNLFINFDIVADYFYIAGDAMGLDGTGLIPDSGVTPSKQRRVNAFTLSDPVYIGSNEAVRAEYETGSEDLIRTSLSGNLDNFDMSKELNDEISGLYRIDPIEGIQLNYSNLFFAKDFFLKCQTKDSLDGCEMVMNTVPNVATYYISTLVTATSAYTVLTGYEKFITAKLKKVAKQDNVLGMKNKRYNNISSISKKIEKIQLSKAALEKRLYSIQYAKSKIKTVIFGTLLAMLGFILFVFSLVWRMVKTIVVGTMMSHIISPFLIITGRFNRFFELLTSIALSLSATVIAFIISTTVFNLALSVLLKILIEITAQHPSLYVMLKTNSIFILTTFLYSMFLFLIVSTIISTISKDLGIQLDDEISEAKSEKNQMQQTFQIR